MNKMEKEFKQKNIEMGDTTPSTRQTIDAYLRTFQGQSKIQRAQDWYLKGAGNDSASFLQTVQSVSTSIIPTANNTYSVGSPTFRFLINGVNGRSGSVVYYVATSSGGAVTTAVTFEEGILT